MNAISTMTDYRLLMPNLVPIDPDRRYFLCAMSYEESPWHYEMVLDADISRVSLEGMNRFVVSVTGSNEESGCTDSLFAELELNLRLGMSSVAIAAGTPHYFSVTGRSLNIDDQEIDSSIHEAVDLG